MIFWIKVTFGNSILHFNTLKQLNPLNFPFHYYGNPEYGPKDEILKHTKQIKHNWVGEHLISYLTTIPYAVNASIACSVKGKSKV